jgi:hypothetical protein
VEAFLQDDDDLECYRESTENGAVKFVLPGAFQPGTLILKATLGFSEIVGLRHATGWAGFSPEVCVGSVGKAKQSWVGLNATKHFSESNVLGSAAYFSPLAAVPAYGPVAVEVTSAVSDWVKNPQNNHGLILTPAGVPAPKDEGYSTCWSGIGNVVLEIEYIAP